MSIIFNSTATKYLSRATSLPAADTYSFSLWIYATGSAAGWQTLVGLKISAQCGLECENLALDFFCGGGTSLAMGSLTANQWNFLACSLVRSTSAMVGVRISAGTATTYSGTGAASSGSFTSLRIGYDNDWGQSLHGYVADFKWWTVAKTATELLQEAYILRPADTTNLYYWLPMFPGSGERARDYSGVGGDWTENGTLTDGDGPPISWGAPIWVIPWVTAGVAALNISVSDTSTLSETISAAPLALPGVNGNDTATLSESVTVSMVTEAPLSVSVSDTVTLSESITRALSPLSVSVTDSTTISENTISTLATLAVTVSDTATLSESISVAFGALTAVVSDTVAIGELAIVQPGTLAISVTDAVSTSENVSGILAQALILAASDNVALSESVGVLLVQAGQQYVSVTDDVLLAETITVSVSVIPARTIDVSDSITASETITVSLTAIGAQSVTVADETIIAEFVMVTVTTATASIVDAVVLSESIAVSLVAAGTLQLSVVDSAILSDAPALALGALAINVVDSMATTETIALYQPAGSILYVSVEESMTLGEAVTSAPLGLGNVTIIDTITVADIVMMTVGAFTKGDWTITLAATANWTLSTRTRHFFTLEDSTR